MEFKLKYLLRREVAIKGKSSTFAFIIFSLFSFFYCFGTVEHASVIRFFSVIILISNLIRIKVNQKILNQNIVNENEWQNLKYLIWINMIGWSIILNLASFEHKLEGLHFTVITTFVSGLVGASIISLSFFKELFIPFQVLLLFPQIFIILYFNFKASPSVNHLALILPYIMYFLYQLKLYSGHHKSIIQHFIYQIRLENNNIKLKKTQDELLRQTVQLVHTSRLASLGEMSAGIAHEINNPISIISASSKMIEREIHANKENFNKEIALKNTERISRATQRIGSIVKGLKHFSNHAENLPKEHIAIKEIIEETQYFCQDLLISKKISLNISEISDIKIFCHAVQISQVLINLIKNAADALIEESHEDERWINIDFINHGSELIIALSNGGHKISNDVAFHLFDPFFTTKPVGSGTGLGLSISKNIMKDHHGDLVLDLKKEHTTFLMIFNQEIK